jgi:hypothetical protein
MSDFRKPRPDYPIYPSTGYYRKRAQTFKVPKGRRGRKPKGQRVGNFVKYQDPNYIFIKAEDEARKARELAIAQAKEQEQYRQLQIQDIEDERVERGRKERARQDELQIRRDELRQNQITQREQLRLQGVAQAETQRYRAAKLAQQANQGQARQREAGDILGQLRRLTEDNERRQGENREIFQQFLASQDRRGDLSLSNIQAQEKTDLPEDRRDRRGRSLSLDEEVFSQAIAQQEERKYERRGLDDPLVEGEKTPAALRENPKQKVKPFGASEAELAAAGAIEGQTPRGGSGSEETERRGSNKGKQTFPQPEPEREEGTPVIGGGDWLKSVKLSPATTSGLTESQVESDLGAIAESVKGKKYK